MKVEGLTPIGSGEGCWSGELGVCWEEKISPDAGAKREVRMPGLGGLHPFAWDGGLS